MSKKITDPIEKIVYEAIDDDIIVDGHCEHGATKNLDFYLPDYDVYIEVCAGWTPRKIEQASRAKNVILIQGRGAAEYFAKKIKRKYDINE